MPINFSQFQENVSTPADGQFLVGYFNTAAGGERRTSLSVLRNAILGNTVSPLTANYQSTFATVSSLSALWGTNFALTTAANVLQLSDTASGSIATLQASTTARAGLMTASDKLTLTRLTSAFDITGGGNLAEYIIVAGGGSGGSGGTDGNQYYIAGGGGGAGGALSGSIILANNDSFTITIGAGGAYIPQIVVDGSQSGSNSQIFPLSIAALGGGNGGYTVGPTGNFFIMSRPGGSGGGAYAARYGGVSFAASAGTLGQGFSGGNYHRDDSSWYSYGASGGGGKSTAGFNNYISTNNPSELSGGWGGRGIVWLNLYPVAGGGGGGSGMSSRTDHGRAVHGGGNGAHNANATIALAGQANTGGGGGGGTYSSTGNRPLSAGANGGSGVLIFRYPVTFNITSVPPNAIETNQYDGFRYAIVRSSCVATVNRLI